MAEYRAVRAEMNGFVDLVKTPERAAEVTIQPVDLLGVDAAIIFSDILTIPEAMGLPYELIEKKGPVFPNPLDGPQDAHRVKVADVESDLGYVMEAIRITKKELDDRVPLIGFAGAPWTIFCYMIEGKGSKTFSKARGMLHAHPEFAHSLMQQITDSTIAYLKAQIAAGANLVQVFDSWAGILSPQQYAAFSTPYMGQIASAIQEVPVTLFAKGAYFARKALGQLDCQTVGLDWNMDIAESRALVGPNKTLQGNLDPCALYGSYEHIKNETESMLRAFGPHRHIANLGHGVYPDTDPDKVRCFIDTVKAFEHTNP